MVGNRHPVAALERRHAVAEFDHLAHQLVAEHGAGLGSAGVELEQVSAAKAHHPEAEQHLAGAWPGDRPPFQGGPVPAET